MQKFRKPEKQFNQVFLPFWEKMKNNYPLAISKICKLFKRRTTFIPQDFFDRYQQTIADNLFGKVDPYSFPKELDLLILRTKEDFALANKFAVYKKSLFFEALGNFLSHYDFSKESFERFSSILETLGKKGGSLSFELLMLFISSDKFNPSHLIVLDELSTKFEPKNSLEFDSFFSKPIGILSSDSFKQDYLPFLSLIAKNTNKYSTAHALDGLSLLLSKPSFNPKNSRKIYEIISQEKDFSLSNMLFSISTLLGNKDFKDEHLDEVQKSIKEDNKAEVVRKLKSKSYAPTSSFGSAWGGGA
ncbi:MAG: hypothetical protein QXN37_04360 [Candidatus Anstonellaceae archaeon]